jgi:tetraacyldisaccharide 4'-kinase
MLSERVRGVACFANPDRVAAIHDAIRLGVDAVLLDDGFQHRRVARDLDIVVVDATNPFGFEHVLPRGLLREPLTALRRAGVVVVSRVDQVEPTELGTLLDRLAQLAPGIPIVQCRHHPHGLTDMEGVPAETTYHRALLFAGIGNPQSFVHSVRQLHLEPADCVWWPDHHRYSQADISKIRDVRRRVESDVVLTTHKDAVKLRGLKLDELDPLRVVAIDLAYMDDDEGVMEECLDSVLATPPPRQVAEAPLGSVR